MRGVLQSPPGKTVREGAVERLRRERLGPQDLDDPDVVCATLLERQMNSLVQEHVVFVVAVQDDDPLRPMSNKGLEDVADEPNHRRAAEARGAREDLTAAALGCRAVAIIDGR